MSKQSELSIDYNRQHDELMKEVEQMENQLQILKGNNLIALKNKIRVYRELATEAKKTAELLSCFS